jgi:hypothetical protein
LVQQAQGEPLAYIFEIFDPEESLEPVALKLHAPLEGYQAFI